MALTLRMTGYGGHMHDLDDLLARLAASVGPAVHERPQDLANPPAPRESWIDLQHDVVAAAAAAGRAARRRAAAVLLRAVLDQPSFGPSNRLTDDAFALILDMLPDELDAALAPGAGGMWGGGRYLVWHVWSIPGEDGARWLRQLCDRDSTRVGSLIQEMLTGQLPRWPDADFPARLDVLAALPPDPRPVPLSYLNMLRPPVSALPALGRVVLAHGASPTDYLVRTAAEQVRAARTSDPARDVDLFDWPALARRPALGMWLLELSGAAGDRTPLVRAAVSTGLVDDVTADRLAAPMTRPGWADGEVPWQVHEVAAAGSVRLPDGRLSGGDPWWTGGQEGIPFTVDVPSGEHQVEVLTAHHPLARNECAALRLTLAPNAAPVRWELVEVPRLDGPSGYSVEVGVASLAPPQLYEMALVHDSADADRILGEPASWLRLDGGEHGSMVMCTVGPQHQTCLTWTGYDAEGRLVAVITDLGLLEPNPATLWAVGR